MGFLWWFPYCPAGVFLGGFSVWGGHTQLYLTPKIRRLWLQTQQPRCIFSYSPNLQMCRGHNPAWIKRKYSASISPHLLHSLGAAAAPLTCRTGLVTPPAAQASTTEAQTWGDCSKGHRWHPLPAWAHAEIRKTPTRLFPFALAGPQLDGYRADLKATLGFTPAPRSLADFNPCGEWNVSQCGLLCPQRHAGREDLFSKMRRGLGRGSGRDRPKLERSEDSSSAGREQ